MEEVLLKSFASRGCLERKNVHGLLIEWEPLGKKGGGDFELRKEELSRWGACI
jgi:hypothetical protein